MQLIGDLLAYIREINSPVLTEHDIALAFYEENGKEEAIKTLLDYGVRPPVIFNLLSASLSKRGPKVLVNYIPELHNLLDAWGEIETQYRQDVSDFLCSIILELDTQSEDEKASSLREKLGMCFIEQQFTDVWDL